MEITIDTHTLIEELLGANVDAATVHDIRFRLSSIVLPWRSDGSSPPKFIRETALGVQLGIVDSWLGGYGNPHSPELNGVGFHVNGPNGQGVCDSGIVYVEHQSSSPTEAKVSEKERKDDLTKRRNAAFATAKRKVDDFLAKEFSNLVLLERVM